MLRGLLLGVCAAVAAGLALLSAGCVPSDPPVVTGRKVATPLILLLPETDGAAAQVNIVCATEGATIRYTLDGSAPSASEGTVYTGAFTVSEATTIRAIAYKAGMDISDVGVRTFTPAETGEGPAIADPVVLAALVAGRTGTVFLSCTTAGADSPVQSVTADLSALGGSSAQPLSATGGFWSWSGSLTPPTGGSITITLCAIDARGISATATLVVAVGAVPVNQAPTIGQAAAAGSLVQGQAGTVHLTCTASDGDGSIVSVTADLSAVGGAASQALVANGSQWTWIGTVTPAVTGTRTITFTATDDHGATAVQAATLVVMAPNQPPAIAACSVSGDLTQGETASITIRCTASDPDGTVAAATADLSAIGGGASQALAASGGEWTWTGDVNPTQSGTQTLTFRVTDDRGDAATATAQIVVLPPNVAPVVNNASLVAALVVNQAGEVTVSCTATDADGAVQSVVVDLTAIGGAAAQPLQGNGEQWTWTGTVTPASHGDKTVTFTATDDRGATATATAGIHVNSSVPGTLAGAWSGDVTYTQALGGGEPATSVLGPTVTFSSDYQPETLPVCFGDTAMIVALPASGLLAVGDTSSTVAQKTNGSGTSTVTVTGTVTSVSRSPTAFSIDMDVQIVVTGTLNGSMAGTYHWQATLSADDELVWSETTPLTIGLIGLSLDISSAGTLSRQ